MPSLTGTPAQLVITGATGFFEPARFAGIAASLTITGATASAGPASSFSTVTAPKLDTQKRQIPIGLVKGNEVFVTAQEQLRQQNYKDAIEAAFAGQQDQITDLGTIVARLEAAEAQAAQATATANATAAADALSKSFITPVNALTATSDGVITITAHTRTYGDATIVSVDGGSLSGWSAGDYVQVYYDDAARAGGAVAYQGTVDVIAQQGARHIVGGVTIPTPGEVPSLGISTYPPGYIPDYEYYH